MSTCPLGKDSGQPGPAALCLQRDAFRGMLPTPVHPPGKRSRPWDSGSQPAQPGLALTPLPRVSVPTANPEPQPGRHPSSSPGSSRQQRHSHREPKEEREAEQREGPAGPCSTGTNGEHGGLGWRWGDTSGRALGASGTRSEFGSPFPEPLIASGAALNTHFCRAFCRQGDGAFPRVMLSQGVLLCPSWHREC